MRIIRVALIMTSRGEATETLNNANTKLAEVFPLGFLGVPFDDYSIMGPKTLFKLLRPLY